jgi:serine/threonine protein kinase
MAEQFSIPTVGDLIAGKYRVEQELGRGAYGVVFRADQEELGRHVAVKTLLPQAFLQQDIVQRFHREAQLISRLDHPNIIRLYDYGVDEGLLYMAVEYVEGRTLMDIIENDAPLEPVRVRDLALQILDALEHAHQQGIVHRDLKPDNIVLLETKTSDGREFEVVKILDFGISKLLQGDEEKNALKSLTQDGTVLGTPHYMSPENIVGDPVDHRADLYAFGVILYEMLTGAHPFDAPSPSAVMVRHLRDEPEPLPEEFVDTALGVAITQCLEKQPWDRIGSARDLIEILEPALDDLPTLSRPRPMSGPRPPAGVSVPDVAVDETLVDEPRRERPIPWAKLAIVGVLLTILAVSVGWKLWLVADRSAEDDSPVVVRTPADEPPEDHDHEGAVEGPLRATAPESVDAGEGEGEGIVIEADETESEPDAGTRSVERPAEMEQTDSDDSDRQKTPSEEADEPPREVAHDRPRRRPPREKPIEPPEETKVVEVAISSVPTNASVTIGGTPVGSTPLKQTLTVGRQVKVRFSHIGYKEKIVTITPTTESRTIKARLDKDHLRLVD